MTAVARPLPPRFVACFLYTVRVCVPPRRWAVLAIPAVAAVAFGLLALAIDERSDEVAFSLVANALFGLVMPFATLVVGDAVLGAERRSGALAQTWLSPTPFVVIIGARWVAGWTLALVALLPAMALAALVAGVPAAIGPLLIATAAGSSAYLALFILLGATFQRAVLWSLGFVFIIENLMGSVLSGIAQLSPSWLSRNVYAELGPDAIDEIRTGMPAGWGAVIRLALIAIVCLALGTWRLRHLKLTGATD